MYRRFLSVRYFRTRLVNWLSVAGVMVGVAVMIVVWSVMAGFQGKVREVLRGTLSHLIVRPDGTGDVPDYATMDAELRRNPEIVATAPHITAYVAHPYRTGASAKTATTAFHLMEAEGIDWDREKRVSSLPSYVKAQSVPGSSPFKNEDAEYRDLKTGMFSLAFLEHFVGRRGSPGKPLDPAKYLGERVDIALLREEQDANGESEWKRNNFRVVVSAVYDAEDQQADFTRVFFDRATLARMASTAEWMEIRVALKDYGRAAEVRRDVRGRVPAVEVETWEEVKAQFLKAVNNEKVLLMIVLSFIVLLASFTILATLTLTVVEKTRDIGVVKALGGTTGGILSIFLRSGLLIGIIGGALGLGLGIFLVRNLNPVKEGLKVNFGIDIFPADIYLFRDIPTVLEPSAIATIVLGSVVLSFFAGLLPALRAARMDPVVALRHE